MRTNLTVTLLILLIAICMSAQTVGPALDYPFKVPAYADLTKLFDYDSKLPLNFTATVLLEREGVRIADASYASPMGGKPTSAYLVRPAGKGPFPAVVLVHSNGGRDAMLPLAVLLARSGAVTLALQPAELDNLPTTMRREIIDIRRAYDLLAARSDVDAKRVAYVGHSFGAMMGSVVAGVDNRFRCFVLDGGNGGMTYHIRLTNHPAIRSIRESMKADELRKFLEAMAPYDAIHYIGHAAPTPLLFQFARFDLGVSEKEYLDLYARASEPKQMRWYETSHEMAYDPAVLKDRVEFLAPHLGLRPIVPLILEEMQIRVPK